MTKPTVLITRGDLASRWKLSETTLAKLDKLGQLRPIKFGRRVIRYHLDDILAIELGSSSMPDPE